MIFSNKVQKRIKDAGWHANRNVLAKYADVNFFDQFPQFLKDFLKEYGALTIVCEKVITGLGDEHLYIQPENAMYEGDDEDDYWWESLLNKKLFPFAIIEEGPGYRIACDEDGKVYMLGGGDGTFLRGNTFEEGVENVIERNWKGAKEYDDDNNIWVTIS